MVQDLISRKRLPPLFVLLGAGAAVAQTEGTAAPRSYPVKAARKGAGPAIQDLIAGSVQACSRRRSRRMHHVQTGRLTCAARAINSEAFGRAVSAPIPFGHVKLCRFPSPPGTS